MTVKIINNDDEYNEALEMLSELLRKSPRTSEEENTIQILLLVIKDFEQKHEEPFETDPIDAIKFRMEQMNLKQKDLIPFLGSRSKVSEILSGRRQLSLTMIRNLNKELGIPLNSLVGSGKAKLIESEKINFSLFPLQEMQLRGYLGKIKRSISDLKEYAEELIMEFCGEYSPILEQNIAFLRAPLHRRGQKQINQYNLAIWQICVLKKAEPNWARLPKFNSKALDMKWLRKLITLSQYSNGHLLAKEYLEKVGITLVIESHFPKTFLDGAAILYEGNPVIGITLRHNRVDSFWFVLAHELAHVMKHMGNETTSFFIDDLEASEQLDKLETEADSIANEALIPAKIWKNSVLSYSSYKEIQAFAEKAEINPAIVAGRIRYHRENYSIFSKLFYPLSFN